jgi:hypothetical protein
MTRDEIIADIQSGIDKLYALPSDDEYLNGMIRAYENVIDMLKEMEER